MGGAGAAVSGDKESASINPASLHDVEGTHWDVFPLLIQWPFAFGLVNDSIDLSDQLDKAATEAEKRVLLEDFLREYASLTETIRLNLYPSYTRKNLHIGLLLDFTVSPRFRLAGTTSNQLFEGEVSNGTAGLIVALSHAFLQERLKVGVTVKPLYRLAIFDQSEITVHDIFKGQDPGANMTDQIFGETAASRRAFGLGVDLGARYDLPILESWRPSLAVTYQDIGDTRFWGSDAPARIKQSVSLGAAVTKQWGIFKNTLALDFRDVTQKQTFGNKLHLGAELSVWDFLAFRAGLSQLYWTLGASMMTKFFDLDVFVAAEESGEYARLQEIRTLGLQLSAGF
jgi:hypothetical protein